MDTEVGLPSRTACPLSIKNGVTQLLRVAEVSGLLTGQWLVCVLSSNGREDAKEAFEPFEQMVEQSQRFIVHDPTTVALVAMRTTLAVGLDAALARQRPEHEGACVA